jgi:polysaccharide deacetylase family protein (PEP-CTERM system associated)
MTAPVFLFTVDVEDWFQVENFKPYIPYESWPDRELRVESNTRRILDLLDDAQVANGPPRATFFMLGWIAERRPGLVREIVRRGHEVASHGYRHALCTAQRPEDLRADLTRSRKLLEDATGGPVVGYRAPSFSISDEILKQIEAAGYRYDASHNSFEMNHRYGRVHLDGRSRFGGAVRLGDHFWELPVSNLRLAGRAFPLAGGGYFRLFPGAVFRKGIRAILNRDGVYSFYMHPWEIDPDQPRVAAASPFRRFRHYLNLDRTAPRLAALFRHFSEAEFLTCRSYLRRATAGAPPLDPP